MKAIGWFWRRWGQMLCFAIGAGLALSATTRYSDLAIIGYALSGAAFLFTRIGLRATTFWREANPRRLPPGASTT